MAHGSSNVVLGCGGHNVLILLGLWMVGVGCPVEAQNGAIAYADVSGVGATGMQLLPGREGLGPVNVMISNAFSLPSNDVLQVSGVGLSAMTDQGYLVELIVPPGAWPSDVRTPPAITVYDAPATMLSSFPDGRGGIAGPVLDLGPLGMTLNTQARLRVPLGPNLATSCNSSTTNVCQVRVLSYIFATKSWIDISRNISVDWNRGVVSTDVGIFSTLAAFSTTVPLSPNYNKLWVPPVCGSACITGIVAGVLFGTLVCTFSLAAYFQGIPPLPSFPKNESVEFEPLVTETKDDVVLDKSRSSRRSPHAVEAQRVPSSPGLISSKVKGSITNSRASSSNGSRTNDFKFVKQGSSKMFRGAGAPSLEADIGIKRATSAYDEEKYEAAGKALKQTLSQRRNTLKQAESEEREIGTNEHAEPIDEATLTGEPYSKALIRKQELENERKMKGQELRETLQEILNKDKGPMKQKEPVSSPDVEISISETVAGLTDLLPKSEGSFKNQLQPGQHMC